MSSTTELDLHFRADVHERRRQPDTNPLFSGTAASISKASTGHLASAGGSYTSPTSGLTTTWLLNNGNPIPYSNLRGTLNIEQDGTVTLFAGARVPDGITVMRVDRDGRILPPFTSEGSTAAQPGGVQSRLRFTDFVIEAGAGTTGGEAGVFEWKPEPATWPPTGDYPR